MKKQRAQEGREDPTQAPRLAILVLGMHRSGTSAITRILNIRGASLPEHLIPANDQNALGYFESELLYPIHDDLLATAGTTWYDLSPFPQAWFTSPEAKPWIERVAKVVSHEVGESRFFVVKDPRLCRLLPFWRSVLGRLEAEGRFVLPVRDPLETARSLQVSAGIPERSGLLLWLEYFLSAERATRGERRAFVSYASLLRDWRDVVDRMGEDLGLDFPRSSRGADAEVDAFLSPDQRHQQAEPDEIFQRGDVHPWIQGAYRWALEAAAGDEPAAERLDALRAQLDLAEAAFGPALASAEEARRSALRAREEARTRIEELEATLEEGQQLQQELRAKIGEERKEIGGLEDSVRMLMRWVVDRVRSPDEPAPASLKATLDAAAEAPASEIPGIASTALLLAEQTLQIEHLERERASRAAKIDEMAGRLQRSEALLQNREQALATSTGEQQNLLAECDRLRLELDSARARARELDAALRRERRERERLTRECATLLTAGEAKSRPGTDTASSDTD